MAVVAATTTSATTTTTVTIGAAVNIAPVDRTPTPVGLRAVPPDEATIRTAPYSTEPALQYCTFVAHGVRIGLRSNRADALEQLANALPFGAERASLDTVDAWYSLFLCADAQSSVLYADDERLAGPTNMAHICKAFESHVTMRVAETAPRHVFVHAGVVSWRGHAIVFPGYSFSGKTTLVAKLVAAGAIYYSDEYAVFDESGRVQPYARALQIRKAGEREQCARTVQELGGIAGKRALAVSAVLLVTYKAGGTWRPKALSPGRAALEMFGYTMSAQRRPEAALDALRRVVANAQLRKGVRGEASQIVAYLSEAFHR